MPRRFSPRIALVGLVAGAALLAVGSGVSAGANNSEQVIFSKTGAFSPALGPFGFWIWCEADSANPYQGECNGSMYFYAFGPAKHVDGEVTERPEGIYTMDVTSRDGSIACTLKNADEELQSGPRNTVLVDCTSPPGTATATGSVAIVTGPE